MDVCIHVRNGINEVLCNAEYDAGLYMFKKLMPIHVLVTEKKKKKTIFEVCENFQFIIDWRCKWIKCSSVFNMPKFRAQVAI